MKLLNKIVYIIFFGVYTSFPGNVFAQQKSSSMDLDNYAQTVGILFIFAVFVMFILFMIFSDEKYKYSYSLYEEQRRKITLSEAAIKTEKSIPKWFNYIFYGTIIIAVIYLLFFHL